jgi:hypothetical protein
LPKVLSPALNQSGADARHHIVQGLGVMLD